MIVCALDYKGTKHPLTCTTDGNNIAHLAETCHAKIKTLYDRQATKSNVCRAIQETGRQCAVGDYLVFFYAGHGCQLPDQDGDEKDGKDDAYCLVDENGGLNASSFLRDDDFAQIMTSSVPKGVNVIIISDCCHSGTVADFSKPEWLGHRAISMSGCQDKETSGDTGKGGIFTHSLLLGVEKLNKFCSGAQADNRTQGQPYSVGTLFRASLDSDDHIFKSPQHLTMQAVPGLSFDAMQWPLLPPRDYQAPWTSARNSNGHHQQAPTKPYDDKKHMYHTVPGAQAPNGKKTKKGVCIGCFGGKKSH
jgi:hypothetical protein